MVARGGDRGNGSAFLGYQQSAKGKSGESVRLLLEMKVWRRADDGYIAPFSH